jgi:hypothetical protein
VATLREDRLQRAEEHGGLPLREGTELVGAGRDARSVGLADYQRTGPLSTQRASRRQTFALRSFLGWPSRVRYREENQAPSLPCTFFIVSAKPNFPSSLPTGSAALYLKPYAEPYSALPVDEPLIELLAAEENSTLS